MLCLIVAEDVSLTGGPALQRIRLVDEDEQVRNIFTLNNLKSLIATDANQTGSVFLSK